jgi:hypothetical protein
MNGEYKELNLFHLAGILVIGGLFFFRTKNSNKLKAVKKDPSINQYLNRLTEFFTDEDLNNAKKEFLNMIDFGMYPKSAFGVLTFDGELN